MQRLCHFWLRMLLSTEESPRVSSCRLISWRLGSNLVTVETRSGHDHHQHNSHAKGVHRPERRRKTTEIKIGRRPDRW